MKTSLRLFLVLALVATLFTLTSLHRAAADSCVLTFPVAPHTYTYWNVPLVGGHTYTVTYYRHGHILYGPYQYTALPGGDSTDTSLIVAGDQEIWVDNACGGSSSGSSWFDPGDGRVDGKPGDRIAVYCTATSTPPNIDVYGITANGWGHELARFNLADLVQAGQTGLTVTSQRLGQVLARYDGSNLFSVAWPGGQSGAPDPGDFAKDFPCGYPSTATTHGPFSPTGIQY